MYLLLIPHCKAILITYKENETYFTAVLELGDMFDGGGVLIDHYIIQVDNGTQLETAHPTYSFDIMYNTTLSVNISAHNCAGYSNPFPLEIEYKPGGVHMLLCKIICFFYRFSGAHYYSDNNVKSDICSDSNYQQITNTYSDDN